ncbi:hypothetical protein IWQ60_002702 [Tieghemiomyces parasiticus]|uniref:Guanylyl cyclase n=1 Tax=Tieghemiomyces parasiticus TaxID=78921 RepID=A0A9W8DVF9_9FUNG|nr:hypothetical protein IWQ60_002702 [Tieghemiomyces parasiticus]
MSWLWSYLSQIRIVITLDSNVIPPTKVDSDRRGSGLAAGDTRCPPLTGAAPARETTLFPATLRSLPALVMSFLLNPRPATSTTATSKETVRFLGRGRVGPSVPGTPRSSFAPDDDTAFNAYTQDPLPVAPHADRGCASPSLRAHSFPRGLIYPPLDHRRPFGDGPQRSFQTLNLPDSGGEVSRSAPQHTVLPTLRRVPVETPGRSSPPHNSPATTPPEPSNKPAPESSDDSSAAEAPAPSPGGEQAANHPCLPALHCASTPTLDDTRKRRGRTFYHPVPHVMQWYSWDCGLACVCMLLRYYGLTQVMMEELLTYCSAESVWTIDLAYILRKYLPVDFTYYTRYLGINPAYLSHTFYQDTMDDDQQRIEQLFQIAHRQQIRILRIALPLLDIKRFVAEQRFAIIMLVNAKLLRCEYCLREGQVSPTTPLTNLQPYFDTKDYVGHFILVVGYNFILDTFYYRDPALADELCQIKAVHLERARASEGTDFDSIVVRL